MKPINLYQRKPESIDKDIDIILDVYSSGNHLRELENIEWCDVEKIKEKNIHIDIRYYKYHNFDGRRIWVLASVWYKNNPVMVIQNAGREGTDYRQRFITNKNLYIEMIEYIYSLTEKSTNVEDDIFDENDDIEKLDNFYNYKLDGYFDYYR